MTLVRFNTPGLVNRLANEAFYSNLFDSNLGNQCDCSEHSNVKYYIHDEKESVNIDMAIPGLSKEDLVIELNNDVLTIKTKERDENDTRTGFSALEFEKLFRITDKIEKEGISARSENGILYVNLPKVKEAIKQPARSIEIV